MKYENTDDVMELRRTIREQSIELQRCADTLGAERAKMARQEVIIAALTDKLVSGQR